MSSMKVGTRLGIGFGAMMLLLIAVALLGIINMHSIQNKLDNIINDEYPKSILLDQWVEDINTISLDMRDALLTNDQRSIQAELNDIDDKRKNIKNLIEKFQAFILDEKAKTIFTKLLEARTKYLLAQDIFIKLLKDGKQAEAKVLLMSDIMVLQDNYIKMINEFNELQGAHISEIGNSVHQQVTNSLILIITLALTAVLVGVGITFVVVRKIMKQLGGEPDYAAEVVSRIAAGNLSGELALTPGDNSSLLYTLKVMQDSLNTMMNDITRVATALANGDLTQTIDNDYPGVFGKVQTGVNTTVTNLKELVGQISDATDTINTASREIAAGNSDLSQRTEEQASSLEETASSMEELTSTVKLNADNARQANQLAINASEIASNGGVVVGKVITTMNAINDSSRKIVEIISVIDGIAFQTNILALNAAVEAARAGEQGRGFAVVAGEVRNLAQRSAAAAKEIKTLIGNSVEKVEGGSKLVVQAGQTMEEIVLSIKRVTDIMSEITAASAEQSAGIQQINVAVTMMDEVTQQNAALVEEAAAAAETMEKQAQSLALSVGVFKVDNRTSFAARREPLPAKRTSAPRPTLTVTQARKNSARTGTGKITVSKYQAKPQASDEGEWEEF